MARRTKTPTLLDRGHGIGRHSWINFLISPKHSGMTTVQQICVYDVYGENLTRYNLDTGIIQGGNVEVIIPEESAPWSWAQVREVVSKDLATIGSTIGQAYGECQDSTIFGLYHGKRPSWMSKDEWERSKTKGKVIHDKRSA